MDLISRQNAIDVLIESNLKSHMDSTEDEQENSIDEEFIRLGETIDDEILNSYFRIRSIVMSQSSAERKGKWIMHLDDLFPAESTQECSQCHHEQPLIIDNNYCPNCGADMRGEENG